MELTNKIMKLDKRYLSRIEGIKEDDESLLVRFRKNGAKKPVKRESKSKYWRVVTGEKAGRAEIFLYGFIGQDLWFDAELNEESLTDIAVVRAIRELEKDFERIDIRINSPGGSVMDGDPIIAAIRNSSAEIHTYIDGIAASMAADIWLSGHVRHVASNSKLMIHSTSTIEFGTAKDMRAAAERLEKFDNAAIKTFAEVTNMTEDEIRERFYDFEDHWLTADEVAELGLVEKVETFETAKVPADAEKQSIRELVKAFQEIMAEEVQPTVHLEDLQKVVDRVKDERLKEIQEYAKREHGENVDIAISEPPEPGEESTASLDVAKAKIRLAELD